MSFAYRLVFPSPKELTEEGAPPATPAPPRAARSPAPEARVPAELVERTALIGPAGYVAERLAAFRESGVTTLNVTPLAPTHEARVRLIEQVRALAD